MRILFLSYWGCHDPLTTATVLPHIKILSKISFVEKIVLCTIEREQPSPLELNIPKVELIQLNVHTQLSKSLEFLSVGLQIISLCKRHGIERMICRSSLAGSVGYVAWLRTRIPFYVESFEPHADYMLESGVWSKWGFRFILQRIFEHRLKKRATMLMPVSDNYLQQLLKEGIPSSRLRLVPCSVSLRQFEFNDLQRQKIRQELKISNDDIVGIYVGKYGGIYYKEEAFQLFKAAFNYFQEKFWLMLITTEEVSKVIELARQAEIPLDRVTVRSVPHELVASYLSAADFAFSTIKPSPSRKYCSPIKNGEYWANGLPILIEDGIGDDSEIIKHEGGGVIIRRPYESSFSDLRVVLGQNQRGRNQKIRLLAEKYRNFEAVESAYLDCLSR